MSRFIISFILFIFILFRGWALERKSFKVCALYWSMNIEGQVAMRVGLEKRLKKINQIAKNSHLPTIKLQAFVAGDGDQGIDRQIKQMNQAIDNNYDLIIVQPTDVAALSESLKKANKKGIPVVAYDQYILGGKLKCYLTSDNYQAGFLDGEYIASRFPNDKIIKIIIVEYPNVSSAVSRVDGFIDALDKYKQAYDIIATYKAVEAIEGKKVGVKILSDFPSKKSVDVIFTINDGAGLAIVDELDKANRKEIMVATVDGDARSVQNIKNNRLTVIDSAQFCSQLGKETINVAYNILLDKKTAPYILIPTFPVTKQTAKQYKGWYGEHPNKVKKVWMNNSCYWLWQIKLLKRGQSFFFTD